MKLKQLLPLAAFLALLIHTQSFSVFAHRSESDQKLRKLEYILEPVFTGDAPRFRIEVRFAGEQWGETRLVLPSRSAGQSEIYKAIKNLEVLSPNAKLSETGEPHIKLITHAPGQQLRVRYELTQEHAGKPSAQRDRGYRPLIQKDYFHWLGSGGWARPDWKEDQKVSVSFEWKNLPKGWTIANSFGAGHRRQKLDTNLGLITHTIFVGGDFRLRKVEVKGKPVYIAMRGAWNFKDEEFAVLTEKIFDLERGFWNDYDCPYYLLTLIPLEEMPGGLSLGGTGLFNSFATFSTPNASINDFKWLLAHKLFHNWNPQKIGRFPKPEQLLYWFSEGFTNYFTYRLLLRGGLITVDEYIKSYNENLREYYFSPARTESNERVLKDFFSDPEVGRLPYWRGMLLAANWDALIRQATGGKNSLDDVMRDLFNEAKKGPLGELSIELIRERISRYAGRDIAEDLRRHIDAGEMIAPEKNMLGPCAEQVMVEIPTFELGFDLETLRSKKMIAGVKTESAAHRAGLRDGQSIVKRTPIYLGDATKEIEMTVKEGEQEKTIRFYPASLDKTIVPQFRLSDKQRAECAQR